MSTDMIKKSSQCHKCSYNEQTRRILLAIYTMLYQDIITFTSLGSLL